MGFTVNPLKIIRCDRQFNDPINDHFSLFPMHREFTNPDLRMAYYFQFILGILNALAVSHEGSMIKYFYNHLDNNLRVFAINGDEIFLHNIYYGKPGPQSSQTITTGECEFLGISPKAYKSFIYSISQHSSLGVELIERKTRQGHEINVLPLVGEGMFPIFLSNENRYIFNIKYMKTFTTYQLKKLHNALLPHYRGPTLQESTIPYAAFIHGFLLKSVRTRYYKILVKSPLVWMSHKIDGVSICLPKNEKLEEFTLLNFTPHKNAAFDQLSLAKNEDLSVIQLDVAPTGGNELTDGIEVKFTFENIIYRMKEAILAKPDQAAAVIEEYSHEIRFFLETHDVSDTSNLKHFFRGLLLTSANSQLYNGGEAMLLEGKLDCVLSFTTTDVEVIPRKSVSVDVNSQVLHLTFITSDGRLQNLQFSTSSYSGEFGDIREWPMLTPNRLKSHIGEMLMYRNIDKNQVRKYTRDVQASLRDLTRAMDPRHKNREQCLSFIKGVMAHFQDSDSWTTQADISMALHMEVFKEIETVQVSLPMDEDADVIERILDDEVLETSAVKMAYNWHNDDFTMVGLNEEMSQYTTDNVHTACSSSLRKKRHMPPSGCLRLKKEHDAVKVDETKVKEMIVRKNPLMEEHLTSIYEISGKIQVGLLARDFLGDVVRGDYKRLAVDTMFFGGLLVTQKLGRMASSAGARLGSVALKSFGLCLPKLAFDAYMIYEIVEQIKTKDVQGAITTGVYLLLDLAECAAEIMVAFGLINPIIVPILAIASTVLLVGQAIYEAVAKVKEINRIIPLDPYEFQDEYFRELLHFGTDKYVQHLVDEKQANEFLASRVLKNYRNINRFLISAAIFKENKTISFIDNNIIDLTRKRTMKKRSRAMPDMKDDRLVFCSMYEEDTKSLLQKLGSGPFALEIMLSEFLFPASFQEPSFDDFVCDNAFGVSRRGIDVNSEKTLFLLFDGKDEVTGFPNASNVFLIGNGEKTIHGGNQDDYFKISADHVHGHLNGGAGYDTIDLGELGLTGKMTIVNNSIHITNSPADIRFDNFEVVLGRANHTDYIMVCNTSRVDLAGAMDTVDSIVISDPAGSHCSSPTNLTVHMRRHTHVQCTSSEANVTYLVADDMNSRLSVTADVGSHHFYFENMALNDMRIKELSRHYKEFQFVDKAIKLKIKGSSDISFEFNDGVKMVFTDHKATAYLKTTESIFEIMEKYAQLIENDPFITLIVETDEEKLVFNHNYHTIEIGGITKELNVIVDNDQTDAHLVAHRDAENYFFLLSNHNVTNHKEIDLKIHTYGTISFIDLHQLARQIHAGTDSLYGLHAEARKVDENVELELYMIHNRYEQAPSSIGKITLINVTEELDSLSIDVYQRNKLVRVDDEISLSSSSVGLNKSVSVVQPGQFDFYTNLFIDRYVGDVQFFKQNTTMMLTNTLTANAENCTTIFLSDFWLNRNKYQTVDLVFNDQRIKLGDFVGSSKKANMKTVNDFWTTMLDK